MKPKGPWPQSFPPEAVTRAIKAIAKGVANEGQQKTALRWIVEDAAATYGLSYQSGERGERDTCFMEGRRYVGLQIVQEINVTEEGLKRRVKCRTRN